MSYASKTIADSWPFPTRTGPAPTDSQPQQEKPVTQAAASVNVNHLHYVPDNKEVGVFHGSVKPVHTGLYKRITKKGNIVWSFFTAAPQSQSGGTWGMYGSNKPRAMARKNKASKQQSLPWIGAAQK